MTPDVFRDTVLDPGIAWCEKVPGWHIPFDDRARVLLLAIAGQESDWSARVQSRNGPAHSFWQMERLGGVQGVLTHPATKALAVNVCRTAELDPSSRDVWRVMAMLAGDNLSVAFARMLLWTERAPLPIVGDEDRAWVYYDGLWRPGKPDRARWARVYPQAVAAIQ